MTDVTREAPQALRSTSDAALLTERLKTLGFDHSRVAVRLQLASLRTVMALVRANEGLPPQLRHGRYANGLDACIDVLVLGRTCPTSLLSDAVGAALVDLLLRTGLIAETQGCTRASSVLLPWHGLYLATDRVDVVGVNQVMPLYPESFDFPLVVGARRARQVLDLCTGSGVHALLAATRSGACLGVDTSRRAIQFSCFNAWLNQIDNAEFRLGDLYAACSGTGSRFDLIMANPPYNPSLSHPAGANYASGGESGEEVLSRIVGGLPEALAPDGIAHIITLIVRRADDPLEHRLRAWLGGTGEAMDIRVSARDIVYRPHILAEGAALTSAEQALAQSWRRQKIQRFQVGVMTFHWSRHSRRSHYIETAYTPETLQSA